MTIGGMDSRVFVGPILSCCGADIRAVADAAAELVPLKPRVDDAQRLARLAAEVIPAFS
jgi:hypothetical protein